MQKMRERRPADFVRAPVADEQLLRLWSRVEHGEARRLRRSRRWRQGSAAGAALGVLIATISLLREGAPTHAPVAGVGAPTHAPVAVPSDPSAALDRGVSDAPRQLSLADGSQLLLGTGTRARVLSMREDEVRVRLERGQLECDVARAPQRRFIVEAGAFEVVVTGTRFTVAASGEGVLASNVVVSVERGSVEVREPPDRLLAALGAGQLWASDRPEAGAPRASADEPSAEALDAGPASAAALAAPPSTSASSAEPCSSCAAATPTASPAVRRLAARLDPRTLLTRASDARRAGKLPEAVAALEELILRHPHDERAGYAAFLLGRIRLDSLDDARSAVEAFSFAVQHPGSGFFAEDAEARLVEALAKTGQMAECAQARDRFLAKYPRAARAASMRGACRER